MIRKMSKNILLKLVLVNLLVSIVGCKSREPESTVNDSYFEKWSNYKESPEGFFTMLAEGQFIPRNLKTAAEFNDYQLSQLHKEVLKPVTGDRREGLSKAEAADLLKIVSNHPVASLSHYSKYDPDNRGIGFCFGRAMTAHLEALWNDKFRLPNDRIRKVFGVGTLSTGDKSWRYHVTTIVKGTDGEWYAIDPIMYSVMTIEQWYGRMRAMNPSGDMLLFPTPAKVFSPNGQNYNRHNLNSESLNNYFKDLLDEYKKQFKIVKVNKQSGNSGN